MQKWEYRTIWETRPLLTADTGLVESPINMLGEWEDGPELEELGKEGWELVAVVPVSEYDGPGLAGATSAVAYFFKRPM